MIRHKACCDSILTEVKRYWRSSEVAVTGDVEAGKMSDIQVRVQIYTIAH